MDYNYSFEANIPSASFNSTAKGILSWIEENPNVKDPNAYEMANVFLFGAKYAHEGKDVDTDTLTRMWEIRSKDFENCNISENHFVYAICEDAYNSAIDGKNVVNDENSHHALRKMAGLGLYLKQRQRDSDIISYNNPPELLQLLECSSSLRTFHPDLFDKYAFEENINALCRLQLENELPAEISNAIESAKNSIFERSSDIGHDSQTKNNLEIEK